LKLVRLVDGRLLARSGNATDHETVSTGSGCSGSVQLINKSNQFNLTTRRYTDEDVIAVMADPDAFGLQLRLVDRFGDNGVIGRS